MPKERCKFPEKKKTNYWWMHNNIIMVYQKIINLLDNVNIKKQ